MALLGSTSKSASRTTLGEYVDKLVGIFEEVRRVLRTDGTLWLNLGDSYAGSWGAQGHTGQMVDRGITAARSSSTFPQGKRTGSIPDGADYKPKDLLGVPWMVAFALRSAGWWLRSDIIWSKPNPMPESVRDRPTSAHEHIFLLSKSARYFYDADAIREARKCADVDVVPAGWDTTLGAHGTIHQHGSRRGDKQRQTAASARAAGGSSGFNDRWDAAETRGATVLGRNKRNVWEISSQPFPGAHFATFPPKLVEPCALAGTPQSVCAECAAPRLREVEVDYVNPGNRTTNGPRSIDRKHADHGTAGFERRLERRTTTTGWEATCGCEAPDAAAVVLDPFSGAGTTGLVALRLGRSYIGIELNPDYAAMGRQRLRDDAPLLNTPAEVAA